MREQIGESELILNADGSIYHLHLLPEDIADTIILVGDPDRVKRVSCHFDSIEVKKQKREFITHTGYLNNKRLTVISTGIGTDNIDIVLNEVDALVNIDLDQRTVLENKRSLQFIRLGTCGSFHPEVNADSIVLSSKGLGLDGLFGFYEQKEDAELTFLNNHIYNHFRHYNIETLPYSGNGSEMLLSRFENLSQHIGYTLTLGGFYGPQGRELRLKQRSRSFEKMITEFEYDRMRIANLEMETAAIYAISNQLGHEALSVSVVVANRTNKTISSNPGKAVDNMIASFVEQISLMA
ncbi:MAG: nucleoside phosphorylase [Bacteroidia bacterium]|nr:nucleoside phosphorylase [Bacteroidia bacterium]